MKYKEHIAVDLLRCHVVIGVLIRDLLVKYEKHEVSGMKVSCVYCVYLCR